MKTTPLSLTLCLIAALTLTCLALGAVPAIGQESPATDSPSHWDRFAARHDQNDDGLVSAEEFGRSDRRFQELDADGDGSVDPEELAQVEARCGAPRTPPAPGAGLVRLADGNRDQELTREEWDALAVELDRDADGAITDEELIETMIRNRAARQNGRAGGPGQPGGEGKPEGSPREPRPLSSHLDANQDGLVDSRDLDEIFTDLDTNGDAVISRDEMPPLPFGPRGGHSRCEWARGPGGRPGGAPAAESVR